MVANDALTQQIAIRLSVEDLRRLDALTERIGVAKRNAIARAALRLGMDVIEADPTRLIASAQKKATRRKQ